MYDEVVVFNLSLDAREKDSVVKTLANLPKPGGYVLITFTSKAELQIWEHSLNNYFRSLTYQIDVLAIINRNFGGRNRLNLQDNSLVYYRGILKEAP